LIAINRSGRELWRRNLENPLSAKIITGWDGRLFVPTEKKIYCYTASGNLLWAKTFASSFSLAPKPDRSGGITFALENNEVWRIDAFGNAHVWMLSNTPAVLVSIEQQQVAALYRDGTIEVLGSAEDWYISAQTEAHVSLLPKLPASPLAAVSRGNNVAAVLSDGTIVFLSMTERTILWNGDSHIREFSRNGGRPEMEAEMLFDDRGIYILSRDGATGFSHDGRRLWFTFLQNAAAIPAFGDDGVLYSGGRDWILYAYKIEDRMLNERQSLYGPAPGGSYGTGRPNSSFIQDFPVNEHELNFRLEQIGLGISAGMVGSNELAWTSMLMMISTGQFHIRYKLEAFRLLGQIGSMETIPWLIDVFRRENEPLIRAAAAETIGAIGVDPEGIAIQSFLFFITNGTGIRDEQVLTAIASATGALCRFSGPPLSEAGIRLLNLLSTNNQPSVVRRQANRELASLR
jgi:outer membrane protein assembly factor BamB